MIKLVEIKSIEKLEEVTNRICPQNERWKLIVEMEKEMREVKETEDVIAYEITDHAEPIGLIQYTYKKAGFLQKEQLIIPLLTLERYSSDILHEVHSHLIEQYQLSGQLIQVIQKEEENTEIHSQLIADGFKENRILKYGYERESLSFVKNIS